MLRVLATLALSVGLLAGAQAQTAPTAASRKAAAQASRTARQTQRAAQKADRAARKQAAQPAATRNDGWPPLDESTSVVASAAPVADDTYGAGPSSSPYGRDNVHAAPGMPVNVRVSKQSAPYSVRPPRPAGHSAARPQTTLGGGR